MMRELRRRMTGGGAWLIAAWMVASGPTRAMDAYPYKDPKLPTERRVEDLLSRMTLEEKIDQLNQSLAADPNPNNVRKNPEILRPTYGSYLFNQGSLAMRNSLARAAMEKSRLGIPAIFGADVIHGFRTIFPIPLGAACSWNPDLFQQNCRVAATEAKRSGVDWTFGPMIDIGLDPRWGRIAEGFGESPYAASVFCVAAVRGYQGDDLAAPDSIAACLKHFVGYGAVAAAAGHLLYGDGTERQGSLFLLHL